MKKNLAVLLALVLAFTLVLTSCTTSTEAPADAVSEDVPAESGEEGTTKTEGTDFTNMIPNSTRNAGDFAEGPNGEVPVPSTEVNLTEEQYEQIKEKDLSAVLLWAGAGEWYNAMTQGAKEEFEKMGVEIKAQSDAQFDPSKQATDIETALALSPDIILTLPVDPVSGTRAFQPAVDAGIKIVFADNGVNDYTPGEEYVAICTGDQYGMGRAAAELMSDAIGGSGKIGIIYYDADFLVTNNRDNELIRVLQSEYPEIQIETMMGFSEESDTGNVASTMLAQYPDLDGIYVSWDVAAEPVVAELRAAGKDNIKLVTMDLGGNNDLDMAQGGNVYGKVADKPYEIGATMAKLAVLSILEGDAPTYVVSGTVKMTQENMVEAWNESLAKNPDDNVMQVIGK